MPQQYNREQQQTGQFPDVKGPQLNDKDRLQDILTSEKYLTVGYNISVNEANNELLYNDLMQMLNDTHQNQRHLYKLMANKGWYKETTANQQEITQTVTQFTANQTQLPFGNQQFTQTIQQPGQQQYWTEQQQFNQQQYSQPWQQQQYPMGQQFTQQTQPNQQYPGQQVNQQMSQFNQPGQQQWQTMPQYAPTTPQLGQHQPPPWRRV